MRFHEMRLVAEVISDVLYAYKKHRLTDAPETDQNLTLGMLADGNPLEGDLGVIQDIRTPRQLRGWAACPRCEWVPNGVHSDFIHLYQELGKIG